MLQYFVTSLIIYSDCFSTVYFLVRGFFQYVSGIERYDGEKWKKLRDVETFYRFIGGKRTYGKMGLYVQRR